jgi:hypothetical protein
VRRRLEEGKQRRDDALFDVLADPAQHRDDVRCSPAGTGFAESYAKGEYGVLLTFGVACDGAAGKYVSVFEREEVDVIEGRFPEVANAMARTEDEMQRPVLVEVVKDIEAFERGPISSTVRLHLLDEVPRLWMHASNLPVQIPLRGRAPMEDREFRVFLNLGVERHPLVVGNSKVKGEMIESRTEVEKALTDQSSPSDQRWPFVDLDYPEALACFQVIVTANGVSVAVDEPVYSALEVLAVHVCPSELLADPLTY